MQKGPYFTCANFVRPLKQVPLSCINAVIRTTTFVSVVKLFLSSLHASLVDSRSQKWWWLSNLKNWSKPPSLVSILDKNRQKISPDKISLAGILSEFWIFFRNIGPDCFTLKFGLSEKHTKFEKNLRHALDVY